MNTETVVAERYAKAYNIYQQKSFYTNNKKDFIRNIEFAVTNGRTNTEYSHGLYTKIWDLPTFDHYSNFVWVIRDNLNKYPLLEENQNGIFDLGYIDQYDANNPHRSGWNFVYNNIKGFHKSGKPKLDMYLDKTFGWNSGVSHINGIIPYHQPWYGFIHHTFATEHFTTNTVDEVLTNPLFLDSIASCKCVFVLSQYLCQRIKIFILLNRKKYPKLLKLNLVTLVHPTDFEDIISYDINSFLSTEQHNLFHVGAWLRNLHFFYQLKTPEWYSKKALKGKNMDAYFIPDGFVDELLYYNNEITSDPSNEFISRVMCRLDSKNIFLEQIIRDIQNYLCPVTIISNVSNEEYDVVLSQNIICIFLEDASACNTLLECIARNTPILINNHPAVVEVIGYRYPLLYSTKEEAEAILQDPGKIIQAYYYLLNMNKDHIKIDTFVQSLLANIS
jgi:hypothetical protein